ncbi:MAG TPA: Uma2 family endonuclease [Nostocaceae cyanobacterium]|nr:Uma2 family endonuclease [Nostocaceae cyanobacterium]
MVIQTDKHYYTPEEYLELEAKAEYKSEYRDGEIIPMPGVTTNHNTIAINFCKSFLVVFADQPYHIYLSDVKLWIPRYRLYTYPDVMIIQGKPIYEGKGKTNITNPLVIVEVLSNSTENYDRTNKFKFYRSIPDFQEYILIDQYSFLVEQFIKQADNRWIFQEYEGENAVLKLHSIDVEIPLQEIYRRVDFEVTEEE